MSATLALFAQRSSSSSSAAGFGVLLVFMGVWFLLFGAIYAFQAFCLSKVFERAGLTRWWAWVPFVQQYGMWKLTAREQFWLILLFVPYANIVAMIVIGM